MPGLGPPPTRPTSPRRSGAAAAGFAMSPPASIGAVAVEGGAEAGPDPLPLAATAPADEGTFSDQTMRGYNQVFYATNAYLGQVELRQPLALDRRITLALFVDELGLSYPRRLSAARPVHQSHNRAIRRIGRCTGTPASASVLTCRSLGCERCASTSRGSLRNAHQFRHRPEFLAPAAKLGGRDETT